MKTFTPSILYSMTKKASVLLRVKVIRHRKYSCQIIRPTEPRAKASFLTLYWGWGWGDGGGTVSSKDVGGREKGGETEMG